MYTKCSRVDFLISVSISAQAQQQIMWRHWVLSPAVHNVEQAVAARAQSTIELLKVLPQGCLLSSIHQLHTRSTCHTSVQQPAARTSSSADAGSNSNSSNSSSSLRSDLGSGSALDTMQGINQDPAQRRQSLLAHGKRFYDTVTVQPCQIPAGQPASSSSHSSSQQGYQLLLRKYPVKTPAKQVLVLPTLSLALAVASEWEWLPSGKPAPHKMPLTGLACTAIDQPKEPAKVIEHLLKYVHTDGACIRYEAGPLERRQRLLFDPLLDWAQQELGWKLHTSESIFGTTQADATVAAVQQYLEGLDSWRLAAMEQLVTTSKSLVIAAALLHGRLTVAEGVKAARLEEDFQLEDWGMVEAGHDLDIADTNTRIGGPTIFVKLLSVL